ncbi:Gamma-aminobutyric acid receptor subunit gamma-1 [Globomyces sp. JEL0801]|nr:Gamma-aminobutyric acid receptor subunit gamma-1 [Globomyces sp. JEL0801]
MKVGWILLFNWIQCQSQLPSIDALVGRLTNSSIYDKLERPQFGQDPTVVKVQYQINRIANINPITNGYEMDIILKLQWNDDRLKYDEDFKNEALSLNEQLIWTPDVYFFNQLGKMDSLDSILMIQRDGQVSWSRRLIMNFGLPFKLNTFPFDTQSLPIKIVSYGYNQDLMQLQYFDNIDGGSNFPLIRDTFQSALWKLDTVETKRDQILYRQGTKPFDMLTLTIQISRIATTYLMKYVIPLYFIGLCSSIGYWIDVTALPTRGGFAVSLLLSTVTLNFVMTSDLPKVAYATALDMFITTIFGFVFISLMEYAIVHYVTTKLKDRKLTNYMDYSFRVVPIPLTMLAIYTFMDKNGIIDDLLMIATITFSVSWFGYRTFYYIYNAITEDKQTLLDKNDNANCDAGGDGDTNNLVMVDVGGGDM